MFKPLTHSFKSDTITAKVVKQLKCIEERKKTEICLANEGSGLGFPSTNLGKLLRSIIGEEFGVSLNEKGPHKPEFVYNIRIHSLMIYTDLLECNIAGDTKAPLLQCFPFIPELKARNYRNAHEL